jgi:fatty-acid peroxygenase
MAIPHDPAPDAAPALLARGYTFAMSRCRAAGTDVVRTRVAGVPLVVGHGRETARLMSEAGIVSRHRALPRRLRRTLVGDHAIQTLDGERHEARKAMMLEVLTGDAVPALRAVTERHWEEAGAAWSGAGPVELHREVARLLLLSVCEWAGTPLEPGEVDARTGDVLGMIEGGGRVGPRHWRGRFGRLRGERWAERHVRAARRGALPASEGRPLRLIAAFREPDGRPLDARVAAVEVLNVVRPTVAVARYVVFTALALHQLPHWRERLHGAPDDEVHRFVQEVRRLTPFFPAVASRLAVPLVWRGTRLPAGRRVVLDLHGTNRDPRIWDDPLAFRPDRFRGREPGPYDLVPQGAGDHLTTHRCPGEWITIDQMALAVRVLTERMTYRVPPQDLTVRLDRLPALPASGFVIDGVRRTG